LKKDFLYAHQLGDSAAACFRMTILFRPRLLVIFEAQKVGPDASLARCLAVQNALGAV